jgi:60 kDa SS-A/Ro ribonucleoprotein
MQNTRNLSSARELVEYVETQTARRGWGRGLRTAVSEWYLNQPVAKLAEEVAPDLARHRHIIRRAHPKPRTLAQNALFQWVANGELGHIATPEIRSRELRMIDAVERLAATNDLHEAVRLIEEYGIPVGLVPARWKEPVRVWEALLHRMHLSQLLENLRPMADAGVFREPMLAAVVMSRLSSPARLAEREREQIRSALASHRGVEELSRILEALA